MRQERRTQGNEGRITDEETEKEMVEKANRGSACRKSRRGGKDNEIKG